ncbi:hypothetical protein D3C78_386760 [compost metagenome]
MTISVDDVKLLKSQRLTDEEDGGGRATGQAVLDGEVNNLFPDISRLDRTLGRIALRKAFAGVMTDNADAYLGAHAILTQTPADPRVSVVLFNTGSQTDERADARNRIESYVVPAVIAPFELLGNQLQGQRALACVQREEQRQPEIGEVYQLVNGGSAQYVRITRVEPRLETFVYEYGNGNFLNLTRRRLDLSISSPLLVTFPGGQVTPSGTSTPKSQLLTTQVADAARYYGLSPLADAINQGDLTVKVQSVYASLVPSATRETPLIDQLGGYRRRMILASGPARALSLTFAAVTGGQSRSFVGHAVVPGSLSLTINGGVFEDDRKGGFRFVSGSNGFTKLEVDYETGELNVYRASSAYTGTAAISVTPGAAVTGQSVTGEIPIELGNRGYAYTLNLADAKPRPGTLVVSYMALGRWQEIRDPGNGELTGEGSGSITFATGGVSLTLNALPDVGSSIIYQYVGQNDAEVTQRYGGSVAAKAQVRHRLAHDGVLPGSLTVTVKVGGANKTLVDQGNGTLSGAGGAGVIDYPGGELAMVLAVTPDAGSAITYSYQQGSITDAPLAVTSDGSGMCSGTIPGAPLKPGSVQISWTTRQRQPAPALGANLSTGALPVYESEISVDNRVTDDGSGNWIGRTGSINYTTGDFTLKVASTYNFKEYVYVTETVDSFGKQKLKLVSTNSSLLEGFGGTLAIRAQSNELTYGPQTDTQPAPPVTFDLLPEVAEPIVPGSLILSWGGETYVDRDGVLYKGIASQTNAGIAVGAVDYAGCTATLTNYPAGVAAAISLQACLTTNSGFTINAMTFRTPGAPLRPASLQITAVRADTAQVVTVSADLNGQINSPVIKGEADITTGIVRLRFTSNPADTSGASDIPVIPLLLRYNTVLYTSLPLDANLIGLDPVRLPADGRVPIYREGEVLVIHHTATTPVGTPTAGQQVSLARDHQAEILVVDASGVELNPDQYMPNKLLGKVTFANPLVLEDAEGNPLTAPLAIKDRVEHMTVCTEVQISGALGINSPVPWDLPAAQTLVSSAVTWGDLQARLYRWFTQKTWNSGAPNWSDAPTGDSTTAQYNQLNYPPVVANKGSIAGKWALVFTSNTAFQVVEEKLGIIANGTTTADCAPINPATSVPYFTILAAGWGSGWAAGNAVRFNTDACLGPLWLCRTVLAGQGTVEDDQFKIHIRGDAD